MANIKVLFFGRLADAVNMHETVYALTEPEIALSELRDTLAKEHPALQAQDIKAAVNQELRTGDTRLTAGDEVAFFPPVSGG